MRLLWDDRSIVGQFKSSESRGSCFLQLDENRDDATRREEERKESCADPCPMDLSVRSERRAYSDHPLSGIGKMS